MEIREFDVIKVGDPLSVLLTCFDKEQGRAVTGQGCASRGGEHP
jgi:hypothetical protein